MKYQRVYLLGEENPDVYLDCYVADPMQCFTRSAILVIPGGAYWGIAEREAEPIAMAFLPHGYNAFVLNYSVARKRVFPAQLTEASLAMKYIRGNAEAFGHDPHKVFATGFSAGGHLCASLATLWDLPEVVKAVGGEYGVNRPDGVMLCYPVITGLEKYGHLGSFKNLFGTDTPTREQLEAASVERHVRRGVTPPVFLMHTSNDEGVDVRNSLVFAAACRAEGIEFEMHVYPDAPHGVALGNEITEVGQKKYNQPRIARWIADAAAWAKEINEKNAAGGTK